MNLDLLLKNGIVALPDPAQPYGITLQKTDIGVAQGRIAAIGDLKGQDAVEVIDAAGLHLLPGIIDSQVHFREPGLEHKEDLETGTRAALLGGVTTIFEMPNTNPSTTTGAALLDKLSRAKNRAHCHYGFFIGASPENIHQLRELERLPGCVGVKVFMGSSTGSLLVEKDEDLEKILSQGSRRVAIHSEDEMRLRERKPLAEQALSAEFHPEWRDELTSILATQRLLRLAQKTKRAIHVLHITTAQEIQLLREAKEQGLDCTVECTPQHLTLAAPDCYQRLGTLAQMNPPIREEKHRLGLWQGVQSGVVDVIGSDHAPHTLTEKQKKYPQSPSGMPGVQTLLPLMLDHVHRGQLSLNQLVRMACVMPAKIYSLKNKGMIQIGFDADLTVVDLKRKMTIEQSWLASRCGWSPFTGQEVTGWPVGSFLLGKKAMWEGEILLPNQGQACEFSS